MNFIFKAFLYLQGDIVNVFVSDSVVFVDADATIINSVI